MSITDTDELVSHELASRIAIDHLGQNVCDTLRWMNQWMRGQFKSYSYGHTVYDLRNKSCTFEFVSTGDKVGVLTLTAHPKYGTHCIRIDTNKSHIGFGCLSEALDYWEGKISLSELYPEGQYQMEDE